MRGEKDSNQYGRSFTRSLQGNWFVNNGRKSDRRFYRGWILEEGRNFWDRIVYLSLVVTKLVIGRVAFFFVNVVPFFSLVNRDYGS